MSKFAKDLLDVADNLSRAAESVPVEARASDASKPAPRGDDRAVWKGLAAARVPVSAKAAQKTSDLVPRGEGDLELVAEARRAVRREEGVAVGADVVLVAKPAQHNPCETPWKRKKARAEGGKMNALPRPRRCENPEEKGEA